jgi:adenylylsulfate kinase-like enzyme
MILVLFGQPCSGKTTIANSLLDLKIYNPNGVLNIDGDYIRKLFDDKDFTKEGRIRNLNRASDIAYFLDSKGVLVIMSLVFPYKEGRDYLNKLIDNIKWVYLTYDKNENRGRETYHVSDFEIPDKDEIDKMDYMQYNTSGKSIEVAKSDIIKFMTN